MAFDKQKYEQMLMELADQYPELKDDVLNLQDGIMDLDGKDIGDDDSEEPIENEGFEADEEGEGDEAELNPTLGPRPGKPGIPPELEDDEDENAPMPAPSPKRRAPPPRY